MASILVTGATGNVGREVAALLRAEGASVVEAVRTPSGGQTVRLDFRDRGTWAAAARGCDRLFLVRPPAIADVAETLVPFVDVARAEGVGHVVFLSVAGAGRTRLIPHRRVEDHLRARDDRWTSLRPGFFAQNLETAYRDDIVRDDRIFLPAGQGLVNWIDVRDVAAVAARVLLSPDAHRAQAYTLSGPRAVPWSEVTGHLTAALGRPIRYEAASVPAFVLHLRRRGLSASEIVVQTVLHGLLRFGQGATEDPTLARLLGRPGRPVDEYIRARAAVWARPAAP